MWMNRTLVASALLTLASSAPAQTTLPPASADWIVLGTQPTGTFGSRIASAGDVDGDGYDDVAIGDPSYDGAFIDSGRVTIHRGSSSGPAAAPAWTLEGNAAHANLGWVVRAGDVNGDGFDDVLIGEGPMTWQGGSLYLGSAAGPVLSSWTTPGYPAGTGDFNGDGYADLVFLLDYGRVIEIFHGSPAGLPPAPSTVFTLTSDFPYISGIAIDDFSGDGYDDMALLLVYYPENGSEYHEIRVHRGSPEGLVLKRRSYLKGSQFHALVGAGDVDADGFGDVVISSGEFPFNLSWLRGRPSGLSSQPISFGLADATVKGLGDFNGDGFADLVAPIIGGFTWRLDVYAGGPAGYLTTPVLAVNPIQGQDPPAVSAAGDVNGDGFADLVASEPGYDAGGGQVGRVFVFLGRPTSAP